MEAVSLQTTDLSLIFNSKASFIIYPALTPEQTGIVERRHRTIRELGMTLIFHSGVPKFLWVEAFTTAAFLINHLPSSSLAFDTPYFRLYGSHPKYSIL